MRTPEEIFKSLITIEQVREWRYRSLYEFYNDSDNKDSFEITFEAIKEAQIEAYNEALEDAAQNALIRTNDDSTSIIVDKQSILKLKK